MRQNITITVENLGPIRGPQSVELHPFMMFSGASGLGKSYLAMVVHFFFRILTDIDMYHFFLDKEMDFEQLKQGITGNEGIIYRLETVQLLEWLQIKSVDYVRRMTGNKLERARVQISIPELSDVFTFTYSRNTMTSTDGIMDYVETLKLTEVGESYQLPQSDNHWGVFPFFYLVRGVLRKHCDITTYRNMLMPPSRGSLVIMPDDVRSRIPEGMYREFLDDMAVLKNSDSLLNATDNLITANRLLHDELLHGDIVVRDNELQYQFDALESPLPLSAAASSIKEAAPLALMIQKRLLRSYSILFEEPESHLHPELQVKVAELLGYALREGASLQITTHSDYLMRYINDLMCLHLLRQLEDEKHFENYCKEKGFNPEITIDPQKVGAYILESTESGMSSIRKQDISMGIPFDTFDAVINEQMGRSADLYDYVEYLMMKKAEENEVTD